MDDADSAAAGNGECRRTAHEMLDETRTAMEEIAARILFIKKEGRPKSELRELVTLMSLHFVTLRQLNRTILVEEDRIKAETENAKAPVDLTMLQLHNLMYEKNHYLRAIKTCKDFKSKYPDIELVAEEEFFASAPEDIKGKVLAKDASHDLMLKRLNYELFQRKELCKLHEKLEQQKANLLDTISSKKKFLSSLPSQLKSLKKASLPVQQQLGIMHTKKQKQYHAAELLPPPLYIIYTQLLSHKEAFGERIELDVIGSVKDAQAYAILQVNKENGVSSNIDDKRMEDEALDDDEDGQRRRKRPNKAQVKENAEQGGVSQLHPLKVFLRIYDNDDLGAKPLRLVTLRFEYLVKLNVVCVGVEDTEEGYSGDILCNLFPDDTGVELPHPMAKLYSGDSLTFGENRNSRPYKWVQHLAGIDFLPEVPPLNGSNENLNGGEHPKGSSISHGLSIYRQQNRVQTILKMIRSRKKAQMALVEQLDSLSKCKWPSTECENFPWVLHDPLCILESWSQVVGDSSLSASIVGQSSNSLDLDLERRSVTSWEVENAREDGELPTALPVTNFVSDLVLVETNQEPELTEHSRGLALISKNVTPSKKAVTGSFRKNEDDLELIVYSDSELEEVTWTDQEAANSTHGIGKPWEEHVAREFEMILSKTRGIDGMLKLNAKVKISMEYPIRPPLFSLGIDGHEVCSDWFNVLRAMEAEVNAQIIDVLPLESEKYVLGHQIRCLAMLFDCHFDSCDGKPKSSSSIDIGLCNSVNGGASVARSIRGRDRRKMIFWRGIGSRPEHAS